MPIRDQDRSAAELSPLAASVPAAQANETARRTTLGLLTYALTGQGQHGRVPGVPDYRDPVVFITEAAKIGASAVQYAFGIQEAAAIKRIRQTAEELGVALEGTLGLPRRDSDMVKFEAEMQTLSALGARVTRTVLFPGRRYEDLKTLEAYKAALATARDLIGRGEPVARKYRIPLAIENHKDQRIAERVKLLEEVNSEFVGACIDVGNNLALLEEPVDLCRALAPWGLTVHFKDQAIREYEEGFLLADVPLGRGCIDLPAVIRVIREQRPAIHFQLELITRDALKVPILTDQYWATLPDLKASQLATAWNRLKHHSSPDPFIVVSALPPAERVKLERHNVEESFRYAAEHLGFA